MISRKMAKEINAQINREFFSAFLYLAMANDAIDKGYLGTGKWMSIQFKEEQTHALKFSKYLQDQGAKVELVAMPAPKKVWKGILDMFQDALAHEKKVTAWIYGLNALATKEKDYATQSMLKWFIDEQVEEEANCNEAISALSLVGTSAGSAYMVDRHIGKRGES
jgi:ferritin